MRHAAHGLELEHEVERRNFKRADVGHAEKIRNVFDCGTGQPAFLFLRAPQKWNNRAGLAAFWVFGHLRFGPSLIGGRKGESFGLIVI